MTAYTIVAPHPICLPDGTSAAPGQVVELGDRDAAGFLADRQITPTPETEPDPEESDTPKPAGHGRRTKEN